MTAFERFKRDRALLSPDIAKRVHRAKCRAVEAQWYIMREYCRLYALQSVRVIMSSTGLAAVQTVWNSQAEEDYSHKLLEMQQRIWKDAFKHEGLDLSWFDPERSDVTIPNEPLWHSGLMARHCPERLEPYDGAVSTCDAS